MVVNIIEQLKEIGLSEYEGKIYTGLLNESPLTAYEAAKKAGIPTSKVYGVIDKLTANGVLLEISEGSRKKYAPQDPEELIANYRFHINRTLNSLESELKRNHNDEINYIWNLNDHPAFIEKAERMLAEAEENILISLWPEELEIIRPFLEVKEEEGIKIAVVLFGNKTGNCPGMVFPHPIQDTLYNERGGRGFALVVDSKTAMVGTLRKNKEIEGAFSRGPGFIILAEDYIKHDVYIMKIVHRFDGLLQETYGPGYEKLRYIFSNEEVEK